MRAWIMSKIVSLCDEILKNLTRLGIPTAGTMLSGLSEDKIRQCSAGLPFVLPDSVIALYQWSEGSRVGGEFFPGFWMESLSDMIRIHDELSNHPDFRRFRCGDIRWFPIFRSSGADFYGVRCQNVRTLDGEIFSDDNEGEHRLGMIPPPVEFVSLEAMLQTLLCAYDTGVYFVNNEGDLDVGECTCDEQGNLVSVDMSKFNEVARQFNPGLKR